MKKTICTIGFLLAGCANFDQEAFLRGMRGGQPQNAQSDAATTAAALQLLQMGQPRTLPSSPAPIVAPMGILQSDGVSGTLRYCRYSNGVVSTISSVAMCPMNTN